MLTKQEVKKIAKLARLGLTAKEVVRYQKELEAILNYFEKLKKVDVSRVESAGLRSSGENVMRQDFPEAKNKDMSAKLLNEAQKTEKGYLKVASVFK